MSSYSLVYNTSPVSYASFIEQTSTGLQCSSGSVAASYTTLSDTYNSGHVNNDPIFTHIISKVNAQIEYRLVHNGPKVVEASV